jgi:HD-like signal output (HDOD) protein
LGKLPGLPATYFEVIKKAESPDSSVEAIAEVIARDPALTARLLQMVNSPACGLAEKITSPGDAVSMLGVETVKSLVLCLQLFAQSAPAEGASLSLDQLWHDSFLVAKLAAKVVLRCIGSERMASEAYTAGLLHNIGQIVLATNLSREYSSVVETARSLKCPLQEAELKLMGVTSNQVGALQSSGRLSAGVVGHAVAAAGVHRAA